MFIPTLTNYKPFLIQGEGDGRAIDTLTQFGMVAKSNPYNPMATPKELYANDWHDEDGKDYSLPSDWVVEPLEFSVTFYVKEYDGDVTAEASLVRYIDAFYNKLTSGWLRTFDSYTGLGYRKVLFKSASDPTFKRRDNWARAIFTVTFESQDPRSRLANVDGNLMTSFNAVCESPASNIMKSLTVNNFQLAKGSMLSIMLKFGNTEENPMFFINGGNGIAIKGLPINPSSNQYYLFKYDGTYWNCKGLL